MRMAMNRTCSMKIIAGEPFKECLVGGIWRGRFLSLHLILILKGNKVPLLMCSPSIRVEDWRREECPL